jgi:hypothetical protein
MMMLCLPEDQQISARVRKHTLGLVLPDTTTMVTDLIIPYLLDEDLCLLSQIVVWTDGGCQSLT